MDNETVNIFREQIKKLPKEITGFLSSTNWSNDLDEIGSLYNLSEEELRSFNREATLVLIGIVHLDEFKDAVAQEVGLQGAVLDAVVNATEQKIFAPIRPALIDFFEKEASEVESETQMPETIPTATKEWGKIPDIAPDNLPTGEEESFLPNLAPKTSAPAEESAHPFEEKMKRVFTAGQQSLGDLAIETTPPSAPEAPKPAPAYQADPYREPIE